MLNSNNNWREIVTQAEHYKAIGKTYIHLMVRDTGIDALPWGYVTQVKAGSVHRIGLPVDVQFEAVHPCGLTFGWSIDIETPHSGGETHYNFDTVVISGITQRLPLLVRAQWGKHLSVLARELQARTKQRQRRQHKEEHQLHILKTMANDCARDSTI
jgi:hypothetical protein